MAKLYGFLFLALVALGSGFAQTDAAGADYKLALPSHPGQLQWHADGFKILESSAKPSGREIGIRGVDASGRLHFLGFLFLVPEQAPLTSKKCRDGAIEPEEKGSPGLKILATSAITQADGQPIELVRYTSQGRDAKTSYMVRGFVATGEICGDLEFYSDAPIAAEDAGMRQVFASYRLDPHYVPGFGDSFLYAQILYDHQMYKGAAPLFEQALSQLADSKRPDINTMRRVLTDQAGMAYGISGNIAKSRALFEAAIAKDPDYPLYYYNLACADAEEKKLADAQAHLQQAFARKANVLPGETMPDPATDDSFLPYRDNKEFWKFIEGLR
jgi:tetratricopeptide (TPR) repeat protein